jgi:hypothetical protein
MGEIATAASPCPSHKDAAASAVDAGCACGAGAISRAPAPRRGAGPTAGGGPRLGVPLLSTLVVAVLPKCPICLAAYLGAFGLTGAESIVDAAWLLPITVACLLVALLALGFGARRRRGYGPLLLGLHAGALVVLGRFALDSSIAAGAGAALLIAASIWNTWPRGALTG